MELASNYFSLNRRKLSPTRNFSSTRNVSPIRKNVSFDEISEACYQFSEEARLGRGSFGFGQLYRGRWNNVDVAVKKIRKKVWMEIDSEFWTLIRTFITLLQVNWKGLDISWIIYFLKRLKEFNLNCCTYGNV
jgi:hypothetical protein